MQRLVVAKFAWHDCHFIQLCKIQHKVLSWIRARSTKETKLISVFYSVSCFSFTHNSSFVFPTKCQFCSLSIHIPVFSCLFVCLQYLCRRLLQKTKNIVKKKKHPTQKLFLRAVYIPLSFLLKTLAKYWLNFLTLGDAVAVFQKVGFWDICSQWHMPGLLLLVSPNAFPASIPGGVWSEQDAIFKWLSCDVEDCLAIRLISDHHCD